MIFLLICIDNNTSPKGFLVIMERVLYAYGVEKSTPEILYTDLFHLGDHYIQQTGEYRTAGSADFKGNPMVYVNEDVKYQGKMRRYILLEDTLIEQLEWAMKYPGNLVNAVSYFGMKKDKEHADRCFGLIFDIDQINEKTLHNFVHGCYNDIYPCPNYLVISKSGKGMHLYYVFDEPVRLYPKTKLQLKELKYSLTEKLWNRYTSLDPKPQLQSFDQSFMIAGTHENMNVYRLREKRWELGELFDEWSMQLFDPEDLWLENKHTLEEAKKLYPQWYEQVIVNGEKKTGRWTCKKDLYEWWIRQIKDKKGNGATYGHRYWCVMMLVIYAVKSGVPYEEVKKDAYSLIPFLTAINPDDPFTNKDVKSALECYDAQFATFPIRDISRLSGIRIEKNKRNGRKQAQHMEIMRAIQEVVNPNWRDNSPHSGRRPKIDIVKQWRKENPNGTPKQCIESTGLNKNTVYKWWDG